METNKIEKIPIHLIDEPTHAMRSEVWDSELDDLAASIGQFGLMQPITLRKKGDRYEVVAGHRRLAAHRKIGLPTVDSIVKVVDEVTTDAMKIHENLYRASVNPVDEAVFLAGYQQRSNLSLSELAKLVNRSENWVQTRLDILTYPDYLIEFVYNGKLSMATASILNQIENEKIKESYCRTAAIQGLSATRAKYWLDQSRVGVQNAESIIIERGPENSDGVQEVVVKMRCIIDGQEYDVRRLMNGFYLPENLDFVHRHIEFEEPSNEPISDEKTTQPTEAQ
jgi:ParB family chromosome partitioning protein